MPSIVKASLQAVPGVARVAVSYKDRTATITYDDAKADVTTDLGHTKAGYPSAPELIRCFFNRHHLSALRAAKRRPCRPMPVMSLRVHRLRHKTEAKRAIVVCSAPMARCVPPVQAERAGESGAGLLLRG